MSAEKLFSEITLAGGNKNGEGLVPPENAEIPKRYDAAIVLGGGIVEASEIRGLRLSMEAKIRVLACGTLAQNGKIERAVFTGGKTRGEDFPSEAELMHRYFLEKFPDLRDFLIDLEEKSYDTSTNAEEVRRLVDMSDEYSLDTAFLLLTSASHLKRATLLFNEYGLKIYPLSAELALEERDPHYKEFVERYLGSCRNLRNEVISKIIQMSLIVDKKGMLSRRLAERNRG